MKAVGLLYWSLRKHERRMVSVLSGRRISIVLLNSEPGLNPKTVIGRRLCNPGHGR